MNYPQIKPTLNLDFSNTKTLDPRINFRRGTPGAYYDGKTYAKAEQNLLSYSEDFSNAYWDKTELSINNLATVDAPDGTETAQKLIPSTSNSDSHVLFSNTFIPDNAIASLYVQPEEMNFISLVIQDDTGSSGGGVQFDLQNKRVIFEHNATGEIIDVGNGWRRLILIPNEKKINKTLPLVIEPNDGSVPNVSVNFRTTYAGDGSSGLYIWGAQLEQRDSVTAYTSTMREDGTSVPITKYQPQLMFASLGQPRFDHDPITGESKGLLIEESRTNLNRDSQYFTSTNWNRFNANIFSNYVVAPDGTLTGSVLSPALTEDGYVGIETVASYISYTQGKSYTSSYYLKKGSHNYCQLFAPEGISLDFANFNLDTGEVSGSSNASIEHVGNGWYRCSLTVVANTSATTAASHIIMVNDMSSTRSANKTYTNTDDNIYIWGAQFEEGSFPTSYIKTSGAPSGTDRSADDVSITGENFSSWYRQDEGSLYCEVSTFDTSGTASRSRITLGSGGSDRVFSANGENSLYVQTSSGGARVQINNSLITNVYYKKAIGLKKDDFAISFEGNIKTDTDGVVPLVDSLYFKEPINSSAYLNGHIKKLSYYPQRLTNEQLQQLTK